MIVPRVKAEPQSAALLSFPRRLTVSAGEYTEKAVTLLGYFLPYGTFAAADEALIEAVKANLPPEEYELTVKEGKITVKYGDYLGLRNALSTVALWAKADGDDFLLPEGTVKDAPACGFRSVLLDPARGNPPFENFCNVLILAAKCKMNYFHFHLVEHKWLSVEMDSLPREYLYEGYYTKAQVKELNELCDVLGLEIIPEFDMPAHATKLIEFFPDLACDPPEDTPQSTWAICTGTEATYELYEKIIDEVLELFPNGRYFHMGGDELEFADLAHKRPNSLCHWTICKKCKEFRKKHGLRDRTEQYYYFANYINELVKKRGRRMIMWSDHIDCTRPVGMSTDILMQFWRIAGPGRGPYDGCTFNGQLDLGYQIINSHYEETYIDEEPYVNDEKIRTWRWDERPKCSEENKKNILGGELCVWNYGDVKHYGGTIPKFHFHESTIPITVILMADKLWNGDNLPYSEEYDLAVNRTLFGANTPDGLNIFPGMGSRIPPRTEAKTYPERATANDGEIAATQKLLEEDRYLAADAFRTKVYRDCLQYTVEHRKDTENQ